VAEYKKFLNSKFEGFEILKPLFYSWNISLRFDLQVGETNTDEYFRIVQKRANTLFESVFNSNDEIFLVLNEFKRRKRKIRVRNFVFSQVKNLEKDKIGYRRLSRLYDVDKFDRWNQGIIKTTMGQVNYKNILAAIGHQDFPAREPRLDLFGGFTSKEIYFINIEKSLIFHMYDDRGLDIIASDVKTLRPIYEKYNDWILDDDRKTIYEQMKLSETQN